MNKLFRAFINPLLFFPIVKPFEKRLSVKNLLSFLCTPGIKFERKDIVNRYTEISTRDNIIIAVPMEENIMNKLIWPLRHAKASYLLGNYLGTISLCGMVAEMVTVLLFQIHSCKLNNNPLTKDVKFQKAIFGREFEKLRQYRRLEILESIDIINNKIKEKFDTVRDIRNKYLHSWSLDFNKINVDAISSYNCTVEIVANLIGQDIKDGKFFLNPPFAKYLEKIGLLKDVNQNDKS